MPQIKPEVESFARIKVLGVGGSGNNALNHMVASKVKGVEFIAVNTDAQDLHHSLAKRKIHIGKNLTKGLGTGMNPDLGRKAAEETKEEIQEVIKGSDMVFLASGLGGGTGSGANPVVASVAKEAGALTVAVVTKPFFFEGQHRMRIAEQALEVLKKEVDAIIVVPNDRLLSNISKDTTAQNAFAMCDDILKQAVEGISDLITTPGMINVDFADVKTILKDSGSALMGIGVANGDNRAEEAAKMAINSPLLDVSINGARGVLFSISGGEDLTMFEIQDAAKVITESMDPDARVIFGTINDTTIKKGDLKVTIIAAGFPDGSVDQLSKKPFFSLDRNTEKDKEESTSATPEPVNKKKKIEKVEKTEPVKQPSESPERKIFNNIETKNSPSSTNTDTTPASPNDDDDEWSAVPSFLRRSKIK